ncbi:hypothetical protein CU098_003021, partial [Rhizopus stolonifer]
MSFIDQTHFEQANNQSQEKKKENPAACVFVASLNKELSDEDLHTSVYNHFLQWGPLSSVKVLKDWLKRPYAFSVQDSKKAIKEAPGTILNGRSIRCEPARVNRSICLVSFNQPFHKQYIQSTLSAFGDIEDMTILQPHGKFHSIVIKYKYREDAIKAYLTLKFSDYQQINKHQRWFVEWASNMDTDNLYGICGNTCQLDKLSIFVGNLPESVTKEELHTIFGQHGSIIDLHLIQKPNYRHREKKVFAFIKYQHEKESSQAIDHQNGSIYKDKTLRVCYRQYQTNSKPYYCPPKFMDQSVNFMQTSADHSFHQQNNPSQTKDNENYYLDPYPVMVYYAYSPSYYSYPPQEFY